LSLAPTPLADRDGRQRVVVVVLKNERGMGGAACLGTAIRQVLAIGVLRHQDRLRLFTEADYSQRAAS